MPDQSLQIFLSAIATTQRVQILRSLLKCEMSVGQLAAAMGMSSQALSYHLGKLKAAKLLTSRQDVQIIYYTCRTDEVGALSEAIDHFVDCD